MEIKREYDKLGLVTTTHNCAINLFFRAENGNIFSQAAQSKQAVRDLAVKAIKKNFGNGDSRQAGKRSQQFFI